MNTVTSISPTACIFWGTPVPTYFEIDPSATDRDTCPIKGSLLWLTVDADGDVIAASRHIDTASKNMRRYALASVDDPDCSPLPHRIVWASTDPPDFTLSPPPEDD